MSFTNILYVILFIVYVSLIEQTNAGPTFSISGNHFLKDGETFQYVSGSIHYYRVPSVLWRDRMLSAKAAGLNAIQTYIEWNSHEPEKGVYDWSGDNDLVAFIKTAHEVGLLVILRAGPFNNAERDMGGLPYWLLSIDPKMKLRSSDPKFIKELDAWYAVLLPKLVPLLYKNGGPVITVQIENEYGFTGECDHNYLIYLRDKMYKYLGDDVVLFTTDSAGLLKCAKVEGVLATVDFPPGDNPKPLFDKRHQSDSGPDVNSEFYNGWFDRWQRKHEIRDTKVITTALDELIAMNASVNIFMFHGGTSFGFGAGSHIEDKQFFPTPTNYDFDSPLSECGDPTPKYFAIRDTIGKYMALPNMTLPVVKPKMELPPISMTRVLNILDSGALRNPVSSATPQTFEQLNQRNGYILYSTVVKTNPSDPAQLQINGLADRAHVFVEEDMNCFALIVVTVLTEEGFRGIRKPLIHTKVLVNYAIVLEKFVGLLSRTDGKYEIPIHVKANDKINLLVENQGRICFGDLVNEAKGIQSNVTLGNQELKDWKQYKLFSDWTLEVDTIGQIKGVSPLKSTPSFFVGHFTAPQGNVHDTFLRLDGWKKGLAFLNGFNLGRYWTVGPQLTLYTPAHLFKANNTLVVFETDGSPCDTTDECKVQFVNKHVIDAPEEK